MKIIFWNTYLRSSKDGIWAAMQKYEKLHGPIDLWCFSESTPAVERVLKKHGYHTKYQERAGKESGRIAGQHGIMMASTKTLEGVRTYSLSKVQKKHGPHKTPLLMVDVIIKGKHVTVATAHITFWGLLNTPRRKLERNKVLEFLPKHRCIFGGDLNSVIIKPICWGLKENGFKQLIKGRTWRLHLFRRKMPFWLQLDHAFATYDLAQSVKTTILRPAEVSDHRPILLDIAED